MLLHSHSHDDDDSVLFFVPFQTEQNLEKSVRKVGVNRPMQLGYRALSENSLQGQSEDELAAARMKIEDSVTTVVPCTAEQLQTIGCSTGMLHGNEGY